MSTACLQLSIAAKPENVRIVRRSVADAAVAAGANAEAVDAIRLAVNEAAANAVRHAYGSGGGRVHVSLDVDDAALTVLVRDDGQGFSRAGEPDGGGFGLRLMEALTRECTVVSQPRRGTQVRMVFALDDPD